jgi:hypothetical protein
MKLSLIICPLVALVTASSKQPQQSAIDTKSLNSYPEFDAIFEQLAVVVNQPASRIKGNALEIRQSTNIAVPKASRRRIRNNSNYNNIQEASAAGYGAAAGMPLNGAKERRQGAQQDAPAICVEWCVNIKEQSCERLEGTQLSGESCDMERIQSDCVDSCKR